MGNGICRLGHIGPDGGDVLLRDGIDVCHLGSCRCAASAGRGWCYDIQAHGTRESALLFRGSRQNGRKVPGNVLATEFVRKEEERLLLLGIVKSWYDRRPSDGVSKVVVPQRRTRNVIRIVDISIGIE